MDWRINSQRPIEAVPEQELGSVAERKENKGKIPTSTDIFREVSRLTPARLKAFSTPLAINKNEIFLFSNIDFECIQSP